MVYERLVAGDDLIAEIDDATERVDQILDRWPDTWPAIRELTERSIQIIDDLIAAGYDRAARQVHEAIDRLFRALDRAAGE